MINSFIKEIPVGHAYRDFLCLQAGTPAAYILDLI